MEQKILHTASQLFLHFGFKSVTMDDIALKMGISKKTIYEYYKNKNELVKATTHFVFKQITDRIDTMCSGEIAISPIQSLFDINTFMNEHLKEDNAPEYQLEKYYPDIHIELSKKKFIVITDGIKDNLTRGIEEKLYRDDIDIDVIARLYYSVVSNIKNSSIFPKDKYKISDLMHSYLLYHIRAIATNKGIKELNNYLKKIHKESK